MQPQPLRFSVSATFLASARNSGCAATVQSALRIYTWVRAPRSAPKPSAADMELYTDWQNR